MVRELPQSEGSIPRLRTYRTFDEEQLVPNEKV